MNNGGCSTGQSGHYVAIPFTTVGTNATTITASVTPHGFRAFVTLYQGVYFSPLVNCYSGGVEGSGSGATVTSTSNFGTLIAPFTQEGWTLVVYGDSISDVGSFDVTISSSGTGITIGNAPPPPADTTPPVLSLPATITTQATSSAGATVNYSASATDAVDGSVGISCSPATGATFPLGTTSVGCSAQDSTGNTASGSFSVIVQDTVGPVVTVPSTITMEATSANGAVVNYVVSANDAVDGARPVSCTPTSGSTFAIATTVVQCSAQDTKAVITNASFNVVVHDTTAPVMQLPTSVTLEAAGPSGTAYTFSPAPSATDLVTGTITPACSATSGATFPIGETTVSCHATDGANNTANGSFKVTVHDTLAPVLAQPADITQEATGPHGNVIAYATPLATDAVGPTVVTCNPASGSTFSVGSHTVTCSATDSSSNTGAVFFTVNVADTTKPVLTQPADISQEAVGPNGNTITFALPTATDTVGAGPVTCVPASGTVFAIGSHTVTCSAMDFSANVGTVSFTVVVVDTTKPVVSHTDNIVAEATSNLGAPVTFATPTATDDVGATPVTCDAASGNIFPIGTTTVTCSSTDSSNNTGSAQFTIAVADTKAPTLTKLANMIVEATGPTGATATFALPTATDAVGAGKVVCDSSPGGNFHLGVTVVTCTSTDAALNVGTTSFTIDVTDTTPPVIAHQNDIVAEATSAAGASVAFATPTATDAVGADPVSCNRASATTFALGATTVTCSTHDAAAHSASTSFVITVVDTTAPAITTPTSITAEATSTAGATVSYLVTTADAVDGTPTATCTPAAGSTFAMGATKVTCTATDAAHNTATASFFVNVADTTAPVIVVPKDITADATSPNGAIVTYSVAATDTVNGPVPTSCSPSSGSTFPIGTTTVTCTASDPVAELASAVQNLLRTETEPARSTAHFTVTVSAFVASEAPATPSAPAASPTTDPNVTPTNSTLPVTGINIASALEMGLAAIGLGLIATRRRKPATQR
ncbi:MAG: putative cell surface protein [Ilumatobacteraceae bacterium]|nr:putative cell surface protein [Ilumatobacteraceae bacterium]